MTSRNWCFTIFGDRAELGAYELPKGYSSSFGAIKHARYFTCQLEMCPDTQRPHLQCYAEFTQPVRFAGIQAWAGVKCHCEKRKGTQKEAIDYCHKEDSQVIPPFQWGTRAKQATGGAASTGVIKWIKEHDDATFDDFVEAHESEFIRYANNMERLWNRFRKKTKLFKHDALWEHQEALIKLMEEQDDRDIAWCYDPDGGSGKTDLQRYLIDRGDVCWCSSGGYKDTFHMFSKDPKPYVVCNITREEGQDPSKLKHLYGILEAFKDGMAFSGKYDSSSLGFEKCKVLVLANTVPDPTKWSGPAAGDRDRYKSVVTLSRGEGNTILTPMSFQDVTKIFGTDNRSKCQIELDV